MQFQNRSNAGADVTDVTDAATECNSDVIGDASSPVPQAVALVLSPSHQHQQRGTSTTSTIVPASHCSSSTNYSCSHCSSDPMQRKATAERKHLLQHHYNVATGGSSRNSDSTCSVGNVNDHDDIEAELPLKSISSLQTAQIQDHSKQREDNQDTSDSDKNDEPQDIVMQLLLKGTSNERKHRTIDYLDQHAVDLQKSALRRRRNTTTTTVKNETDTKETWMMDTVRGRYTDYINEDSDPPSRIVKNLTERKRKVQRTQDSKQVKVQNQDKKGIGNFIDSKNHHFIEDKDENSNAMTVLSPSDWSSSSVVDFHPSQNCFGVVHVWVHQAQRLPCPVHSKVQAVLKLHPWKGKIRVSEKAMAFASEQHGVCVEWGSGDTTLSTSSHTKSSTVVSMVHAYASSEDPVPELQLDLVLMVVLGMEFNMASVRIPCHRLLQQPNIAITGWFGCGNMDDHKEDKNRVVVQVEAMFEPAISTKSRIPKSDIVVGEKFTHFTGDIDNNKDKDKDDDDDDDDDKRTISLEKPFHNSDLSTFRKCNTNGMNEMHDIAGYKGSEMDHIYSDDLVGMVNMDENDTLLGTIQHNSDLELSTCKDAFQIESSSARVSNGGDESAVSLQSSLRHTALTLKKSQQHLMRLMAYYKPAFCCICGQSIMTIMFMWTTVALHCEVCGVDCCDNCRLQVDLRLPCGSTEAQTAMAASFQSKLSVSKMLQFIAPFDALEKSAIAAKSDVSCHGHESSQSDKPGGTKGKRNDAKLIKSQKQSIGTMKLEFIRAYVLEERLPADTDPAVLVDQRVRPGEYYVRVKGENEQIVRTPTVQSNGRPSLDQRLMVFDVTHYGTEFRIELVDASTERVMGTCLITTQGLLQSQRDYLVEEMRVPLLSFLRPFRFVEMRRVILELRAGFKSGFSSTDYFASSKRGCLSDAEIQPGDIVGGIEVALGFDEDYEALYGAQPYSCPNRPGEELHMGVFQHHFQRISVLIEDVKNAAEWCRYVLSWKDPVVTATSLVLFMQVCLRFNSEYIGSLPFLFLLVFMLYFACKRSFGKYRRYYIQREIENNCKAEDYRIDYDIHRPIGHVHVCVLRGRNIRSIELGIPGNVGCRILWDSVCQMKEASRVKACKIDGSTIVPHFVGSTNFLYTANPIWDRMIASEETKRLRSLVPTEDGVFFEMSTEATRIKNIEFPILQPIWRNGELYSLESWESSPAALIVEVRFSDLLNVLPGSDYLLGEVKILFSEIVKNGKIEGWYDVTIAGGAPPTIPLPSAFLPHLDNECDVSTSVEGKAQLYIKASWDPPKSTDRLALETMREASHAIQEEMLRTAILTEQQVEKLSILSNSMVAINSVRGISANLQMVQNTLGSVLDICESCLHAFDFTDPHKSMIVLGLVFTLWIVLSILSTRFIVLIGGLAYYSVRLKSRLEHSWRTEDSTAAFKLDEIKENDEESPSMTWIINAIRSLPTSEDLRRTYFWESRRLGVLETSSLAAAKRKGRMRRLWRVQWYSSLRLLTHDKNMNHKWRHAFAIFHGNRFLWWRNVAEFDNGVPASGQLVLAGHAGISSPSPLELREISLEDIERAICVFGGGSRITILTESIEAKIELEKVVDSVVLSKQD